MKCLSPLTRDLSLPPPPLRRISSFFLPFCRVFTLRSVVATPFFLLASSSSSSTRYTRNIVTRGRSATTSLHHRHPPSQHVLPVSFTPFLSFSRRNFVTGPQYSLHPPARVSILCYDPSYGRYRFRERVNWTFTGEVENNRDAVFLGRGE